MSINKEHHQPPFTQEILGKKNGHEEEITWDQLSDTLHLTLRDRISISPDLERLGFIGVINRTNTGGLATAIGRAPTEKPITRHIQPFKAIARRLVLEEFQVDPSTPLTFLKDNVEVGGGVQLIKETIGPDVNNPAEWMESIQLLLEAGIPPEKMFFIPTLREPTDVVASWKRMWGWEINNFPFASFNFSFEKTERMAAAAQKAGILTIPYVHEFLRDFGPVKTISRMLAAVDLPFDEPVINWDNDGDPYWQGNIVKYDLPPDAWIQGSLSVKHGGRGGLKWRPIKPEHTLTSEQEAIIKANIEPALTVYKRMNDFARLVLNF